jgi:hypothetical protein
MTPAAQESPTIVGAVMSTDGYRRMAEAPGAMPKCVYRIPELTKDYLIRDDGTLVELSEHAEQQANGG